MSILSSIRAVLDFLSRRSRAEREMEEEFRSHLRRRADDLERQGLSRAEAERQARIEFGGYQRYKEECRETLGTRLLGELVADVRYGLRQLRRNRGFTAVAVIILALGIGANTTIFSVVSVVLMQRPAVREPDRLMIVASNNREKGWDLLRVSVPNFKTFRRENNVFQGMAAAAESDFTLTGEGAPEHVEGAQAIANYFDVLGVTPALGRTFLPSENEAGRNRVVLLSFGLWKQRFAANPNVMGSVLDVDGEPYTIIGVMPPGTDLPLMQPQLWTPIVFSSKSLSLSRNSRFLFAFARLKPRVTLAGARAEIAGVATRIAQDHPDTEKGWNASVLPLQQYMIQAADVRPSLVVLMGAVLFVLLIACANIAGLLLARAAGRQREIAIRAALGGGRFRVIRQLLTESLLIALAGGVTGVMLALWGINSLRATFRWNFYVLYLARHLHLDGRTLLFTVALTLGVTLLSGLAPALHASNPNLVGSLKESGRTGTEGIKQGKLRSGLVAAEIALGVVLLAGAGLFIQAFIHEITQNPGFNPNHLMTARLILSSKQYENNPPKQAAFFDQLVHRLHALPGVEAVAAAQWLPLEGAWNRSVKVEGRSSRLMAVYIVDSSYFRTLQIPLIQGREFSQMDNEHAPKVAIVNRSFARTYFPKGKAIGQRIYAYSYHPAWAEIVGIVGDVAESPGAAVHVPQVYVPFVQQPTDNLDVVVRTRYAASAFVPLLRRTVWSVDKDQPLEDVMTMQEVADRGGMGGNRFMTALTGIFAGLALMLSAVGIYGVIAYSVARRTHEIGIRMALGAQKSDVLRLVLKQGALLIAIGCAIGLMLSLPLPKLFGSMFNGFTGSTSILAAVGLSMAAISLLATYIPARRAAKVDPMVALRRE